MNNNYFAYLIKQFYLPLVILAFICIGGMAMYSLRKKYLPTPTEKALPSFGTTFSDHMFVMEWDEKNKWHNAHIKKYSPLTFDPASLHMHYGQEIFEGMKAFKTIHGDNVLFRPQDHLQRLNRSANIMCMPEIDPVFVLSWLKKLIALDQKAIPAQQGAALYIRPTMIATEPTINLKPSSRYLFFIILSPVGFFYKEGFNPIPVLVSDQYTRTSIGGVGEAKTGGNYAAAMRAQEEAKKEKCSQVLWLDPVKRFYVEEVGSMNIFFVFENEIVTPKLTGTILPGITRKSVLELGSSLGFTMVERSISISQVTEGILSGKIQEIFGTGTAVVISPIGSLKYKGTVYNVGNQKTGPVTQKIYDRLRNIQYGKESNNFGWLESIN